MSPEPARHAPPRRLPHALQDRHLLEQALGGRSLSIFLDYDGTLAPIVSRPEDALLSPSMRDAVRALADRYPVAVISGRELADVRERVGLAQLYYAGNHGFEIAGPTGSGIDWQVGRDYVDELDDLYQACAIQLPPVDGLIIEHKHYSLSIHYRLVAEESVPALEHALGEMLAERPRLRLRHGKCVFEVRPDVDWHKGKAVQHLLEVTGQRDALPIFVGDDITDEDAFREIKDTGLGILVGTEERDTAADFRLTNSEEVRLFLDYLTTR